MSKKTTSSPRKPRGPSSGNSDPTRPTRRSALNSDPTVQLSMDDLQIQEPEGPTDGDETQLLSEKNLRDATRPDIEDEAGATTNFEIPVEMIEPLDARKTARRKPKNSAISAQIAVHDPFQTRQVPAVKDPSALKARERRFSTIKMNPAQARPAPAKKPASTFDQTASRIDTGELRDIDADGFHVFILRPDPDGSLTLPRDIFDAQRSPDDAMVLVKAKILRE